MLKLIRILLLVCYLFVSIPICSQAAPPRRNQYEDTVTESMWDWVTTLGKSPKEKKIIKSKRRIRRARERAGKKARAESVKREKENKASVTKAKKIKDARIRARRREVERNKSRE